MKTYLIKLVYWAPFSLALAGCVAVPPAPDASIRHPAHPKAPSSPRPPPSPGLLAITNEWVLPPRSSLVPHEHPAHGGGAGKSKAEESQ